MIDLDALYSVADGHQPLEHLADIVALACGTRSAALHVFESGAKPLTVMNYWAPDEIAASADIILRLDPWRAAAEAVGWPGRAVAMDEIVPPTTFMRSEMYNLLMRPMGDDTARCMGIRLIDSRKKSVTIAVHRAAADTEFIERDCRMLEDISAHVIRALRLRSIIITERARNVDLADMVDSSGRAIILIDKNLKVKNISKAALAIVSAQDGLSIVRNHFLVDDRSITNKLHCAVIAACLRNLSDRFTFLCNRPSGEVPYCLTAFSGGASESAILVINDATQGNANTAWLMEAYGLTPAERALALGLVSGLTLVEVANQPKVTRETVRSQMKSLFDKTHTRRQADLIRLLS